ncbi:endonuclease [Kordia sp.]|uniref:endonuclease/exonuclease/phosphatase family protein n=1 Tax=Kordia sp. TaxID=1965332 RepID=UPI003B5ABD78
MEKNNTIRKYHTIAFYNLENLFDTEDDQYVLDNDFLPESDRNWTPKRYDKKIYKLSSAIASIGPENIENPPVLVGVAEVENKTVMNDLINSKQLIEHDYDFVHYNSPDERGIDVGLLYQKEHFEVIDSESIPILLYNDEGRRDFTRDTLYVKGLLNNELIHVFVNHWSSRRDGADETAHKRIKAAETVREKINNIQSEEIDPHIIIMGDFNDDPTSKSIQQHLMDTDLYNPMEKLLTIYKGSLNYKGEWNLFDQIIFTTNFFDYKKGTHSFATADVFDDHFLTQWKGKYKGNPFRTYAGRKYLGGYSDHFPVYIRLKFNA